MNPRHVRWECCSWLLILGLAAGLSGCAKPGETVGPPKSKVTGQVTLDGAPLRDGQIVFVDAEGDPILRYGGPIKNGQYELEATPGTKRVEISAIEYPEGGDPGANGKQLIPARYNEQSTLTAEIPQGGKTGLDFALSTAETEPAGAPAQ